MTPRLNLPAIALGLSAIGVVGYLVSISRTTPRRQFVPGLLICAGAALSSAARFFDLRGPTSDAILLVAVLMWIFAVAFLYRSRAKTASGGNA